MNPEEENQKPDTIFCGLSLLLFCLLVFLNSLSVPKEENSKAALSSLRAYFPYLGQQTNTERAEDEKNGEARSVKWGGIPDLVKGAGAEAQSDEHTFRITLASDLLFVDGDDQLQPKSVALLTRLADEIGAKKLRVEIESHTDNLVSLTARYPSLWTLSIQRAQILYRLFQQRGIPEAKLFASGFAGGKPDFSNESGEGRAKNRRTVILLSEDEDV